MTWLDTSIWSRAFGESDPRPDQTARDRLRTAYHRLRDRAATLSGEICRDIPDLTVHDITHLDALWDLADSLVSETVPLSPAEVFVFGASVLTHDLALTVAARPDGIADLMSTPGWTQTLYGQLKSRLGRPPTATELESAPVDVVQMVKEQLLRESHAYHAARLHQVSWTDGDTGGEYYLIDDVELRIAYGSLIGQIAASHWWPISELHRRFPTIFGSAVGLPPSWTVDPLLIASLLRCADAAHLDSRRAPAFLKAVRQPKGLARQHWQFQEHLHQPRRQNDRLLYTASRPFSLTEAHAWWLCFDTLTSLDQELRSVDALLADLGKERLAVRSVAGVTDPSRLADLITTEGWTPIDASVRISDVPDVVSKLGGRELYGNRARIAVRELVENGADAVRALTAIRTSHAVDALDYHGRVEVSLVENGSDLWIEVKDNGVGMGIEALSGPLVDFGRSAWNDAVARAGRAAANPTAFEPTGRYGIGFFAVFMLGQRVQVISRRYDAAMTDTNVVEFLSGLGSRPIIRAASTEEQSLVGGTTVRVRIDDRTVLPNLFANAAAASRLLDLCQSLFPTIDVDIITRDVGAAAEVAVSANDWERLPPLALLRRISGGHDRRPEVERRYLTDLAAHLTDIRNDAGALVGRVALAPPELLKEVLEHFGLDHTGETLTGLEFNTVDMDSVSAVTVGGAVSDTGLRSMIGVMVGRSTRAARDRAVPLVDIADLQRWVREQIDAIQTAAPRHLIVQSAVADVAALCGLDTGSLGVVQEATGGPLTIADVRQWASRHHEVVLIRLENIWALTYFVPDLELSDTVLCSTLDRGDLLRSALPGGHWPDLGSRYPPELWYSENTTMGRIAIAIAEGWDEDPLRLLQLLSDEDEELVEIGHAAGVAVTESGYRLVRA